MDTTTIQISAGHKQVGNKKHLTEYAKSAARLNQKLLEIPEGNLDLLCNHPEGHNKIQDKCKSEKLVVVGKHPEPNVYLIKPVNGNGSEWTVNQCQLQDLGKTQNDGGLTSHQDSHDGAQVPSFNPKPINVKTPQFLTLMPLTQKGDPSAFSKYQHWHGKQWTETSTTSESHLLF